MPVLSKVSPLIDEFHAARTHGERASILLRVPVRILCRYRHLFIAGCEKTGLQVGADYVGVLHVSLDAVRGPDGEFPEHLRKQIDSAAAALRAMAANHSPEPPA